MSAWIGNQLNYSEVICAIINYNRTSHFVLFVTFDSEVGIRPRTGGQNGHESVLEDERSVPSNTNDRS